MVHFFLPISPFSGQFICDVFMLCVLLICPQTYSQLAHPIQQAKALGLRFQSQILDIDNIDVSGTKYLRAGIPEERQR